MPAAQLPDLGGVSVSQPLARAQGEGGPHPTPAGAGGDGQGGAERWRRVPCTASGSRRRTGAIPVELLEEQAETRVPELVPIRYGRMLVSPFTFFRGAAYLMAADLAGAPRTGLEVQLCGDAHLSNFGAFAAPDRRLVFGVNDFDETLPGPFEWDVKRLVASFAVAGRDRGFDAQAAAVDQPGGDAPYREAMSGFRRDAQPRPLVLPLRRRRARAADGAAVASREAAEALRAQRGQGAGQGQHEGVREAHRDRGRRGADRRATRPSSSRSRSSRPAPSSTSRGGHARRDPLLPADAHRATAASCSSAFATSTRRARSSGSAASARARGSCCMLGRDDDRPAVPAAQGGARPRCSSRSSARASSPTTASASSRVSA